MFFVTVFVLLPLRFTFWTVCLILIYILKSPLRIGLAEIRSLRIYLFSRWLYSEEIILLTGNSRLIGISAALLDIIWLSVGLCFCYWNIYTFPVSSFNWFGLSVPSSFYLYLCVLQFHIHVSRFKFLFAVLFCCCCSCCWACNNFCVHGFIFFMVLKSE